MNPQASIFLGTSRMSLGLTCRLPTTDLVILQQRHQTSKLTSWRPGLKGSFRKHENTRERQTESKLGRTVQGCQGKGQRNLQPTKHGWNFNHQKMEYC